MIAIELKVERTRKGFTQEQMAKILGVSTVSYSKKEDKVNAIFFDGKLPKSNSRECELTRGNEADSEAPCT